MSSDLRSSNAGIVLRAIGAVAVAVSLAAPSATGQHGVGPTLLLGENGFSVRTQLASDAGFLFIQQPWQPPFPPFNFTDRRLLRIFAPDASGLRLVGELPRPELQAATDANGQRIVARSGWVVEGYPRAGTAGAGVVHVRRLDKDLHVLQSTILQSPFPGESYFGGSVAVDGNDLFVSAIFHDLAGGDDAGAVVHYQHAAGQWRVRAILEPDPSWLIGPNYEFGLKVSAEGGRLAVGARNRGGDPTASWDPGSVHLYERDSSGAFEYDTTLHSPSTLDAQRVFGDEIALDGDVIAVSEYRTGRRDGQVQVFQRDVSGTWLHFQTLRASVPNYGSPPFDRDSFGGVLSFENGILLAANTKSDSGVLPSTGTVSVFERRGPGAPFIESAILRPDASSMPNPIIGVGSALCSLGSFVFAVAEGSNTGDNGIVGYPIQQPRRHCSSAQPGVSEVIVMPHRIASGGRDGAGPLGLVASGVAPGTRVLFACSLSKDRQAPSVALGASGLCLARPSYTAGLAIAGSTLNDVAISFGDRMSGAWARLLTVTDTAFVQPLVAVPGSAPAWGDAWTFRLR